MQRINIEWLNKLCKIHDGLSRSVSVDSNIHRCEQQIFIDRYFKFLQNKCFKLKIKDEIYYVMFVQHLHNIDNQFSGYSYGIRKCLSYDPHEIIISFFDEKLKNKDIKLHWNDILKIEYENILIKKYFKKIKQFI